MFVGTAHLLNGNLLCGVYKDYLIIRLGQEAASDALKKPGGKPFDITGRPMKEWTMVEMQGLGGAELLSWLKKSHTREYACRRVMRRAGPGSTSAGIVRRGSFEISG